MSKLFSSKGPRRALSIGLCLGLPSIACAIVACSGGSTTETVTGGGADSGGGSTNTGGEGGSAVNNTKPGSCATSTIAISFSPMYSAFIPGSTAHQFQIPAISETTGTTWSSSDPTLVQLSPDPTSGGVMITIKGTGPVSIFTTAADGSCGAAQLNITSALETDWQIGNARYNDGNSIKLTRPDGGRPDGGGTGLGDAGLDIVVDGGGPACTNCHGPTATTSLYKDVAHTPEQTGGFSDQDLIDIVVNGIVPDGGYFDPDVIIADASADPTGATQLKAYQRWQSFHAWADIAQDQRQGMVVYLRSLTPAPQTGIPGFGGGGTRDGGRRDGSRDATGQ